MRISPGELQAVDRGGLLARYHSFGSVVAVVADFPEDGSTAGTGLDAPCLTQHHGIVLRGALSVHHDDGRTESFSTGTAFYVPAGPPNHTFTAGPGTVVAGFATPETDQPVSAEALEARGFTLVARPDPQISLPHAVTVAGSLRPFRRPGVIEVEAGQMGPWIFMRSIFGQRTGHLSGWCDLPHWGFVIDGEIAILYDRDAEPGAGTELAARGDAFFAPPGHRFVSADGAVVADYTPVTSLGTERVSKWRRATLARRGLMAPGTRRGSNAHLTSRPGDEDLRSSAPASDPTTTIEPSTSGTPPEDGIAPTFAETAGPYGRAIAGPVRGL
ncbi:MAG: hypothetical protein ABI573_05325 [Chloroflexota bacterium]